MREAVGDLGMTVIVIVIIGALAAFLYTGLWPMLKGNMVQNTRCADAVCKLNKDDKDPGAEVECTYFDEKTDQNITLTCPWKG